MTTLSHRKDQRKRASEKARRVDFSAVESFGPTIPSLSYGAISVIRVPAFERYKSTDCNLYILSNAYVSFCFIWLRSVHSMLSGVSALSSVSCIRVKRRRSLQSCCVSLNAKKNDQRKFIKTTMNLNIHNLGSRSSNVK